MTIETITDEEDFRRMHNFQPDGAFVYWIGGCLMAVALLSTFGSANIIIATIRKRKLRNKCHILISTQAVCFILHCYGSFALGLAPLRHQLHMPAMDCFWQRVVPQFGVVAELGFAFVIGLDRYYSVTRPQRYHVMPYVPYVPLMCVLPVSFGLAVNYITYCRASLQRNLQVRCMINGALDGFLARDLLFSQCTISVITLLLYLNIWLKTRHMSGARTKVIKALLFIVTSFTVFWLSSLVGLAFIHIYMVPEPYFICIQFGCYGLMNMCGICDYGTYIVLRFVSEQLCLNIRCSVDYRHAFIEQLCCCKKKFYDSNSTTSDDVDRHTGIRTTAIQIMRKGDTVKV